MAFKIVIRNLPSDFSKEQLEGLLSDWKNHVLYLDFAPGKTPKPPSTKSAKGAAAWIAFDDRESLKQCAESFGKMTVELSKPVIIEMAPFQNFCHDQFTEKTDPLCGTLDAGIKCHELSDL